MSHVVHIVQVKVALNVQLKVIVVISLSIHMMASQDRMCARCVKNAIQRKAGWIFTNWCTVEKNYFRVLSVRNVFQISSTWRYTWLVLTVVNTSAVYAEKVVEVIRR